MALADFLKQAKQKLQQGATKVENYFGLGQPGLGGFGQDLNTAKKTVTNRLLVPAESAVSKFVQSKVVQPAEQAYAKVNSNPVGKFATNLLTLKYNPLYQDIKRYNAGEITSNELSKRSSTGLAVGALSGPESELSNAAKAIAKSVKPQEILSVLSRFGIKDESLASKLVKETNTKNILDILKRQPTGAQEAAKNVSAKTFEQFAAENGVSALNRGDSALVRQPGASEKVIRQNAKAQLSKDQELATQRAELRKQYDQKVASGELRQPSRVEQLVATANGHPDNASTQAARRLLKKQGIDWRPTSAPGQVKMSQTELPLGKTQMPEVSGTPQELAQKSGRQKPAIPGTSLSASADQLTLPANQKVPPSVGQTPVISEQVLQTSTDKIPPASSDINLKNLNISPEAKQAIQDTVETIKPDLQAVKGAKLSNAEVVDAAKSSDILQRAVSRDQTKKAAAAITKLRQAVSAGAEGQGISSDFIDNLRVLKSFSADAGRTLQAFSIGADPSLLTVKEQVVKKLLDLGIKADEIISKSAGVNFDNPKQVTDFYRQYVKPNIGELATEYRYINLLSSPQTHIVNAFSNILQGAVLSPATKLYSGAIDNFGSLLTGKDRQAYVGEVPAYTKGVVNSVSEAVKAFSDAITGVKFGERPDVSRIPTGNKYLAPFQIVPRALEASDAFFRTLIKGGEKEALAYKYAKQGANIAPAVLDKQAADKAAYYVFRAPIDAGNETGQGALLSGIDNLTNKIYGLRKVPGGSWLIPFVQTPMNILKQGIEYSPFGVATLPGAANKGEQLAKALVGSTVFAGAGALVANNDSTWSAPTSAKEKELFYASGRQPYSVKIGNNWVSFSKLGPLSYPIALAAALKYEFAQNPKAATESNLQKLSGAMGQMAQFFSDQSYVRSLGDFTRALEGDATSLQSFLSNMPRQVVPLTSLLGWVTRIVDPVYRQASNPVDAIKAGIPGLSESVPAYTNPFGEPSQRDNPLLNSLSPLAVTTANKQPFEDLYQGNQQTKQQNAQINYFKDQLSKQQNGGAQMGQDSVGGEAAPGIYKVGKTYVYSVDGQQKTTKSLDAAKLDIAKSQFDSTGQSFLNDGTNVFYKDHSGNTQTMSVIDYNTKLYDAQLSFAKANDDYTTWAKTASQLMKNYQQQLQDPNLSPLDQVTLQNKVQTLATTAQKYKSYGGFKKPKKAKKAKIKKPKKLPRVRASVVSLKGISAPKLRIKSPKIRLKKYTATKVKTPKIKLG